METLKSLIILPCRLCVWMLGAFLWLAGATIWLFAASLSVLTGSRSRPASNTRRVQPRP